MSNAQRAGRAIGAMFFSVFGSLWNLSWVWQRYPENWILMMAIVAVGAGILTVAICIAKENSVAAESETTDSKRIRRQFNLINVGQWLAIFVVANVLINTGKSDWVVMAVIFIVGLHFIPLARLFRYAPHYLLGTLLMIWAVCYPWLADGPSDPIGCLGTGLLLWGGAFCALRKTTAALQVSL